MTFDESLNNGDLIPTAQNARHDGLHLRRTDYFNIISCDPTIPILRLI